MTLKMKKRVQKFGTKRLFNLKMFLLLCRENTMRWAIEPR